MSVFTFNDFILFAGIAAIGFMLGWLVTTLRYQQQQFQSQSQQQLLNQRISQYETQYNEQLVQAKLTEQMLQQAQQEIKEQHAQLAGLRENVQQQQVARTEWREECEKLNQELRMLRDVNSAQEAELRELAIRLEETRMAAEEKQRVLVNSEQRLQVQFENLANRIFEHQGRKTQEQNNHSLNSVLAPLREQLDGFRRQVQDSFGQEARERHTLAYEIRQLQQLNAKMTQEAVNLTKALKGDNKTQGNWGEVVLSRILQASGLREGYEYETQVSLKSVQGDRQQPDVLIRLPQDRDVIIDAKMSLVAYERYFNSGDETIRTQAIADHIASIRNHIRLLGHKDYHTLPGLRSLDYVLMFIPVEPAFLLAIDHSPELINEALKHNIMLVSPTTLLVALKTINNLWRYEHQSQNAKQIADRAARLYDKVRLFVEDMLVLGHSLDKAQAQYLQSINKLSQGRGNLLSQIEGFRSLGVEVKRPIPPQILASGQQSDVTVAEIIDPEQ